MIGKSCKPEKKTLVSLLGITFLDQTAITISFPLLTLIFFDVNSRLFPAAASYAERSFWYGLCIAFPSFINVFFAPLLSGLSDELGRKKILLVGIFAAFIFTFLVGLSIWVSSLMLLIMGFFIRGAFAKINPTALAMVGDLTPKSEKLIYMGRLQFAIAVGAFIGPILGGYFAERYCFKELNFSLPFFIAAIIALLNSGVAFYTLKETRRTPLIAQKFEWQTFKDVLLQADVLKISLILLLIQLSWRTYYQFMPSILKTLNGFDSEQLGWFIGMIAFWLMIATSFGLKLLHTFFNLQQILIISVYFILIGFLLTILACENLIPQATLFIWLAASLVAAGDVIAYSCLMTLYSNVVTDEQQGKVMGIGFVIVNIAWGSMGLIGGWLMGISPLLPLIVAPLGVIIVALLLHAGFGKQLVLSYET